MRWRSGPENPDARTALARYMMASRKGSRHVARGPWPCQASAASALRRTSVSASMAPSHCASSELENNSPKSSARSVVSGVAGSIRMRRRCESSPNRSTRGVKPKSASSAAVSISCQNRASSAVTRWRCSALRSSTLSRWRRRNTGSELPPPASLAASLPVAGWRSHSSRRTSHRLRSASEAFGSAALSSPGKSHTGAAPPMSARHQGMVSRRRAAPKPAERPLGGQRTQ